MFLHLRKAFDVIDHSLLRQKLKANGTSGAEHAWFRSYLTNRTHFVQCNGVNSNERTVTHGVPQGSVLGPTIFWKHINGVVSTTPESSMFLYADDTETHHSSPTLETAVLKMNSNLQNISTWLRNNNLIHSWYWAWRKHVTSRDSCYPIGCQILHVLSILYRILQWTDLWGAIHSTKIQTGPTGKRGPPQKVDQFFRNFSGWICLKDVYVCSPKCRKLVFQRRRLSSYVNLIFIYEQWLVITASWEDLPAVVFVSYKFMSSCVICLVIAREIFLLQSDC